MRHWPSCAPALANRVRRLRRSVHLRHIDTGSDGSDEWEIQALTNPVYDLHRLGIFFTASPRHADILLVTGIGTDGMVEPLRRTLDAMPAPTVVIAVGTDAVSGGLIGRGYTGGVPDQIGQRRAVAHAEETFERPQLCASPPGSTSERWKSASPQWRSQSSYFSTATPQWPRV